MSDWTSFIAVGVALMILGFFLIIVEIIRSARESAGLDRSPQTKEGKVKGGGVILIGPVPIVFGTDKMYALILMILAMILMLLIIFLK